MAALRNQLKAAILLITHDLGVVAEMAQRTVVMYAGRVVEEGPTRTIFKEAAHPYTQGLLSISARSLGQDPPAADSASRRSKGWCQASINCRQAVPSRSVAARHLPPAGKKRLSLSAIGPDHTVRCCLYGRGTLRPMSERLLTVRDLKVHFPVKKGLMSRTVGRVKAVDGVSFHLDKGETLGWWASRAAARRQPGRRS